MESHPNEPPTLSDIGLDFRKYGYFVRPLQRNAIYYENPANAVQWLELEALLEQMKRGNFEVLPDILTCLRATKDWQLKSVAARLLGFAGTVEIFRDMRQELEKSSATKGNSVDLETRELTKLYCNTFALWGRLDVVPLLMDQYLHLRLAETPEIGILPILIASLLTDDRSSMIAHEPDESELDDYLTLVMNRYEELGKQLGSEKTFVFRGRRQSVCTWARQMRHTTVPAPFLASEFEKLRARFESATGIDCSDMFQEGRPLALTSASIAERFLESPEATFYREGVRYFFGHRIAD